MARGALPRQATFVRAAEFQGSYDEFLKSFPKIEDRLEIFLQRKLQRPPGKLPKGFADHALTGRLDGLRECHLDGDACLIYTDQRDQITLICVIDHAELQGPRERSLAKRLARFFSFR